MAGTQVSAIFLLRISNIALKDAFYPLKAYLYRPAYSRIKKIICIFVFD